MTEKDRVISCTTVQRLTQLEQGTHEWIQKMQKYNNNIKEIVENVANVELNTMDIPKWNQLSVRDYDEEFNEEFQKVINDQSVTDIDKHFEINDGYLNMEIGLQRTGNDHMEKGVVKKKGQLILMMYLLEYQITIQSWTLGSSRLNLMMVK